MIDESVIKNVLDHADIAAIITQYIPLEKKGADYKGLCPFHKDSHPSLSVSPSKKVFKCFACQEAGNVIQFVQKYKHISFVEALQEVGATCGITIPLDSAQAQRNALIRRYQGIMSDTVKFYEFCLKQTQEGQSALNYLHNRQLNDEVIEHFHIGVAPQGHDKLFQFLKSKDVLELDALKLGLVMQDSNNQYFDYFRQRITFPLDDLNGNIIGISARIYETKNDSKYLTTSENDLFHKSYLLYHYQEAAKTATLEDHIYLFEGFMDVIACYRAGIMNAVASMGTSLTQHQIEAILKVTKNVTIIYDGDRAGIHATQKAIRLFKDAGINPTACLFPNGMDPDEYINAYGNQALKEYIESHTESALDYLYDSYLVGRNLKNTEDADSFMNDVFSYLKDFNNPLYVNAAIKRLATDLSLNESDLIQKYNEFNPIINHHNNNYNNNPVSATDMSSANFEEPDDFTYQTISHDEPAETLLNKYKQAEERIIYVEYLSQDWTRKIEHKLEDQHVDIDLYLIRKAILQEYSYSDILNENMIYASLGDDLAHKLDAIRHNKAYDFGINEINSQENNYIKDLINKVIEYNTLNTEVLNDKDKLRTASMKKKKTVHLK